MKEVESFGGKSTEMTTASGCYKILSRGTNPEPLLSEHGSALIFSKLKDG